MWGGARWAPGHNQSRSSVIPTRLVRWCTQRQARPITPASDRSEDTMLVNPAATYGISQRLTRDAAERLARNWSMVLFSGALLIVSGVLILSIDWTVRSLATFVGALFIFHGL